MVFFFKKNMYIVFLFNLIFYIRCTFASRIQALTRVLYRLQHQESANLELDPVKFENIIESADPQLEGFFKYMMNLVISKERSAHSINKAKKSVVGLCYMMVGLRNKFVNQHKLEVSLYLMQCLKSTCGICRTQIEN